jgi:hypothetical protein
MMLHAQALRLSSQAQLTSGPMRPPASIWRNRRRKQGSTNETAILQKWSGSGRNHPAGI